MTEAAIVQDPVVPPVVEKTYTYQPVDDSGNPLGGPQVIKYDGTPEDLGAKMAAQNAELVKLNRKLKRDLRLGNIATEQIPDNAPKFDESKFQLTPQPLTAEERIQLAQDINDPEKLASVGDRFVRATIGDPEALRTRLARLEQQAAKSNALEEATAFRNANPDYYVHPDNFKTLANWIIKNGLEPVQENFQLAYDTLKEFMIPKPQAAAPVVAPVVDPPPAPTVQRPVSSGLTRSNGSDSGPSIGLGDDIIYEQPSVSRETGKVDPYGPKTVYKGYEALERMPGDEYKRRLLKEAGFREKVAKMDAARNQRQGRA